jgi:hypothetical protein
MVNTIAHTAFDHQTAADVMMSPDGLRSAVHTRPLLRLLQRNKYTCMKYKFQGEV